MSDREARLEELLSEGLDLCVRARKLDAIDRRSSALSAVKYPAEWVESGRFDQYVAGHNEMFPDQLIETRSLTLALWAQDQYEKDLAEWEKRARNYLLYGA